MSAAALYEADAARAALRARQGLGARYDAPTAPARELLWARRGVAYFARKLNELGDSDLNRAAAVPGRTRRDVTASVGCRARALAHLVACARTGEEPELDGEALSLDDEIVLAATLPATALRHLCAHAHVHLDVEWRDLTDTGWARVVRNADGVLLAMRNTPQVWASSVWRAAIDLGNGGRIDDVPPGLLVQSEAE